MSAQSAPRRSESISASGPEVALIAPIPRKGAGGEGLGAVALIYCLLVLCMWGAYNFFSGFPYETSLPYFSETHSWTQGFFYPRSRSEFRKATSTTCLISWENSSTSAEATFPIR
jgi:hypothetical protein